MSESDPGIAAKAALDDQPERGDMRVWIGAGIGAGIGSAAIAAALLYSGRLRKRSPAKPNSRPQD